MMGLKNLQAIIVQLQRTYLNELALRGLAPYLSLIEGASFLLQEWGYSIQQPDDIHLNYLK